MRIHRFDSAGSLLAGLLLIVVCGSCKKESNDVKIVKEKITGNVQKGPYVNGTEISMYELNSSLAQTGKSFSTQITNNRGTFEINNVGLSSQFVEFSATGYYFDEVKGIVSAAPLNLFALSDITDISTVNVNLLTHLEKSRVEKLISQGETFSAAKAKAQSEILGLFGFSSTSMKSSESLDISVNSESNAILLAISIILQGNRTVGDLTELLANIATLLETGNVPAESFAPTLRQNILELNLSTIRTNLESRFQQLGGNATIPNFEKYINDFMAFTGQKPAITNKPITNLAIKGVTLNASVCANSLATTVDFEYGITEAYGISTAAVPAQVQGSANADVKIDLQGLLPGQIYHFRVKAENSKGITYSTDQTFTTLGQVPTSVTLSASNYQFTTATINGTVNPNYLSSEVSFEWGNSTSYGNIAVPAQSPVTGTSTVDVNASLTGLTQGTTYHFRVKAVNELGTTFGEDKTFTTLAPLTDIDGNTYNVVTIGNQVWMAENLRTTKYSNGESIGTTTLGIGTENQPKYQWAFLNDESTVPAYGRLYTFFAATDSRNVCPSGWHVPAVEEFTALGGYLINHGYGFGGSGDDIAKYMASTSGWELSPDMINYDIPSVPGNVENDQASNNSSGFNGIPVGDHSSSGGFTTRRYFAFWWSSTIYPNGSSAYNGFLLSGSNRFATGSTSKKDGISIRCLKN